MLEIIGIISVIIYFISVIICYFLSLEDYKDIKEYAGNVSMTQILQLIIFPLVPIFNTCVAVNVLADYVLFP